MWVRSVGRPKRGVAWERPGATVVRNVAPKLALKARLWVKIGATSASAREDADLGDPEPVPGAGVRPNPSPGRVHFRERNSGRPPPGRPPTETCPGAGPLKTPDNSDAAMSRQLPRILGDLRLLGILSRGAQKRNTHTDEPTTSWASVCVLRGPECCDTMRGLALPCREVLDRSSLLWSLISCRR